MSDADLVLLQPRAAGGTRLVERPDDQQKLTARRETDARTALTRGLSEYLEQLQIDMNGQTLRFLRVFPTWAEPEEQAEYPSAAVFSLDVGEYDASRLSPRLVELDGGVAVREIAELALPITIMFVANSPKERMALSAMLEDALDPVEWMTGARLELPHYFNARATYEKMSMVYEDDEESAQTRRRRCLFTVQGHVTQYRAVALPPRAQVQPQVEIKEAARLSSGVLVDLDS